MKPHFQIRMKAAAFTLTAALLGAVAVQAQPGSDPAAGEAALRNAFLGRQVALKIDMPGSQKGVDLYFDRGSDPMDWNDYSNRLREFGPALRKGDVATVTAINLKRDHIEFQLDGGGFGTARDNAGPISSQIVPKSDEQIRLEKVLKNETDPYRRRDLQQRIDHEEARRRNEQLRADSAAQVANQIKQQQVADQRLHGGSRFNLRWSGNIPADQLRPEAVRMRLEAYLGFDAAPARPSYVQAAQPQPVPPGPSCDTSIAALCAGMSLPRMQQILGQGQVISQGTAGNGQPTQEMLFMTPTLMIRATVTAGYLARFSLESR